MISLARRNAAKQNLKPPHVAFVQASLDKALPIEPDSVDCILSNCVVNLLHPAGKINLLKEAYRVLKPGGRIVLDDILARATLPDEIKQDVDAYIGCISGAIQLHEYKELLLESGFTDVLFVGTKGDLNAYSQSDLGSNSCCSTTRLPKPLNFDVNKWAAPYQIYAVKPDSGVPIQHVQSALLRWWDAYPTAKSSLLPITPGDVAALIRDKTKTKDDYAVIDVRRHDHGGGHVRGSYQWAAQTFYDDLPAFYEKFKDTKKVVFYCSSSAGRGPRCAGWYQDYLDAKGDQTNSAAYILEGGVKVWLSKFGDQEDLVDKD
jgi:arsenite methyltransferase